MGKGSARRTPSTVCSQEQFGKNWDMIFGKKPIPGVSAEKKKPRKSKPKK